jgi:L-amino acid N-acyltransferase YncA
MIIRPAKPDDLADITGIYNEAILTTNATFDTETKTVEQQKEWFESHDARNPVFVAELDDVVIGWASLSRWSDRLAYADTAEISVYVKDGYRGSGTGRRLIEAIIQAGEKAGLHTVIARIVSGNIESLHLHEAFGFTHIGVMKEVGKKSGRLLDVHLMQKIYTSSPDEQA